MKKVMNNEIERTFLEKQSRQKEYEKKDSQHDAGFYDVFFPVYHGGSC